MFDFTGLFHRDCSDDASEIQTWSAPSAADHPANYTVFKDGVPFAILNATPGLAARTVQGFVKATPECSWTYEALT